MLSQQAARSKCGDDHEFLLLKVTYGPPGNSVGLWILGICLVFWESFGDWREAIIFREPSCPVADLMTSFSPAPADIPAS